MKCTWQPGTPMPLAYMGVRKPPMTPSTSVKTCSASSETASDIGGYGFSCLVTVRTTTSLNRPVIFTAVKKLWLGSASSMNLASSERTMPAGASKRIRGTKLVTTVNGVRWSRSATRALPSDVSWWHTPSRMSISPSRASKVPRPKLPLLRMSLMVSSPS